ncbi:hypothetical protein M413DRAFT_313661 [Hebeloma cylindrosporum]|uniref:Uncharacterized protein n=1 Tax=Hebeloma cylindrosporum TaxID=76867 RepID=A0A0C3CC89_HEBCY|nr:hypothetical protein M413DRAFT_313661 [Hebeloma cylindrosporum h7]
MIENSEDLSIQPIMSRSIQSVSFHFSHTLSMGIQRDTGPMSTSTGESNDIRGNEHPVRKLNETAFGAKTCNCGPFNTTLLHSRNPSKRSCSNSDFSLRMKTPFCSDCVWVFWMKRHCSVSPIKVSFCRFS